jgi:N-acetylneuraminic acid mutarotase
MKRTLLILLSLCFTAVYAQSWTQVADIPSARHHPVTWGIDGIGYMVTGTNFANNPTRNFYRYNPTSDSWANMGLFPGTGRSFAIGTVYEGKGYLGFGATLTNYLDDLWQYDPVADTWTELASCPCAGRRHPAFIAVNDAIYVGLGDGGAGNLDDWWKYDMTTDSWSQLPDLPGAGRHHPFQFTVNGQVYAGMGHAGQTIFRDWYRLDPATDTWTTQTDFSGEARVAGTQFNHANEGYVLSGDGDNHSTMATGEFWVYDDANDSWTQLTSHPGVSRWAPGSFVVNDEVYIIGGLNRQASSLSQEVYKYPLPSTVGVNELEKTEIGLFPNPTNSTLNIKTKLQFDAVQVINVAGQIVLNTGSTKSLDVSVLPLGIYQIQITKDGQILGQQRFLKN